jgi:anti-sigma B factor antagonist
MRRSPRSKLDIDTAALDGTATVALDGELDIATVPALEDALADVERAQPKALTLDLGGLGFMDSTGLRALLRARSRAGRRGATLRVANVQPEVARVLEITGVARMIDAA